MTRPYNLEDATLRGSIFQSKLKYGILSVDISAEYVITVNHPPLVIIDPTGSTRDVLLPVEADSEGLTFLILNVEDVSGDLTVKEDSDVTTIVTISDGGAAYVFCDGTTWRGYPLNSALAATVASLTVTGVATLPFVTHTPQTITATTDGGTTAVIALGTKAANIVCDTATKIVVLPVPVLGHEVIMATSAATAGFELRSNDPENVGINGGTATDGESAIAAAITYVRCVAVASDNWTCNQFDADGDETKVEAAS